MALDPGRRSRAALDDVRIERPLDQEPGIAGRRNREVANSLFLSTKSVEGHLTTIYQKLGVRSRSELAARLAGAAELGESTPGT